MATAPGIPDVGQEATREVPEGTQLRGVARRMNLGGADSPSVQYHAEQAQDGLLTLIHNRLSLKRISPDQVKKIHNIRDAAKFFATVAMRNTDMAGSELEVFLGDLELVLYKLERFFKAS